MRKLIITALFFSLPLSCFAWGKEGHAAVGAIADMNLNDNAKAKVAMLLNDDLTAKGKPSGRKTLASVASWADEIKSTPAGAANAAWHYRNNSICSTTDGPCAEGVCIDKKINDMISVLKAPDSSVLQKNEALKWLVHLVGDIHQPLHVGDNGDRGGNGVAVALEGVRTSGRKTLHGVWDNDLVKKAIGGKLMTVSMPANYDPGNATKWMDEGRALAKSVGYSFENFSCGTNLSSEIVTLTTEYQEAASEVIVDQLKKAGLRLAATLNEALR